MKFTGPIIAALLATLPAAAATAAPPARLADLGAIDSAVAQFTGVAQGRPGGAAQPVDRRLALAPCGNPLGVGWYGGRRDTVLVQCPDANGWRLFVPLLQPAFAADAILRGEAVTIAVEGAGFAVSQPGESMDAGPVGAWIRVKTANPAAQPLRAQVVRPGLVRVDLGRDLP